MTKYVTVDVEVDLGDFDDDDLIDQLELRGYVVSKGVTRHDFERVEHLATCGQIEAARAEALALVGEAIGRPLQ